MPTGLDRITSSLRSARPSGWSAVVPVVALIAGVLFAVSSRTANGSDLRSDRAELTQVIHDRVRAIDALDAQRKALVAQTDSLSEQAATGDAGSAQLAAQIAQAAADAGFTAVHGPGIKVTLTDAPPGPEGQLPPGARPDDVIIHQSDVQGVVNAMWAAGADAVMIQGHRLITTTAVRCVGNTLLIAGKTYSPPFVIVAIGDQQAIADSLQKSPGVKLFLDAVKAFGLGYETESLDDVSIPAYDGPLGVNHAQIPGR